jgi:hypothetical protein
MLQLDQSFAYESLPDSELLRDFSFDDLLTALNVARDDGVAQHRDNARFFRDRFDFLKCRTHRFVFYGSSTDCAKPRFALRLKSSVVLLAAQRRQTCAEHVQQLGSESLPSNLMEVKE